MFGIWVIVLIGAITYCYDWRAVLDYIGHEVKFTEPMFVVVIMAMAGTRPVLRVAEACLRAIAGVGRGSVGASWLAILIVAPLLGSFITEPAAMTIGALLLARQFHALKPSPRLAYATLGLLFVNVSVGGTLTHFAAPPVLKVAGPWQWTTPFKFLHFGWNAALGIVIASTLYYFVFRRELGGLETKRRSSRPLRVEAMTRPCRLGSPSCNSASWRLRSWSRITHHYSSAASFSFWPSPGRPRTTRAGSS